jgi:hypothetical protein
MTDSTESYLPAEQEQVTEAWAGPPIPVVNATERLAPEYGSTMTWTIPVQGTGLPVQLLTRRIRRHKAKIGINFTVAGTVILNSNLDHLSTGQGYVIVVPSAGWFQFSDWESQQPLYAIATVAGITASVVDETHSSR